MSSSESENENDGYATPPKRKKYCATYKPKWEENEEFKSWLSKSTKGVEFAYCKVCTCDLNIAKGGKTDIQRHEKTQKHSKNKLKLQGQRSIYQMPTLQKPTSVQTKAKEGEIRIAAFAAEHNIALNVMDHLVPLIKAVCPDSEIGKNITCGRTKTTKLITEVLGSSDIDSMAEAMRDNKFSLSLDESTDKSTKKHLAVIARVCRSSNKIEDYFFEMFEVQEATAEKLHEAVTKKMIELNIPYKTNMIGLAADGANVMMGRTNSVAAKFKQEIPQLFIMKCVCHSVALVASNACLQLPREPEDLARDIYNYLNGSPKRAGLLKEFQDFLELKPHKILQPSQTRWLSLELVVKRLLEQYEALKLYFRDAVYNDRLKSAENIMAMLDNPMNKLYFQFMEYSLQIFNALNRTMQSEYTNVHCIYKNVLTVINTILGCYIKEEYINQNSYDKIDYKNPRKYLPIEDWYFGAKVAATISTNRFNAEHVKQFKLRCLGFYIEAITQLLMRFPHNDDMAILQKMGFIAPQAVRDRKIKSIADILGRFPNIVPPDNIQTVDTEWRLLRNTPLDQNADENENETAESFWQKIAKMRTFPNLTAAVFNFMCLPHSSAAVERLFSQINVTKTKLRNKMSTELVSGTLHTKNLLKNSNCYDFNISPEMLSKHNSKIY